MSIVASEIAFKFTTNSGAAGNTTAGTAAASLGKWTSTTVITDATLNNLFDDISGDENALSTVDYRCVAIHNTNATLTLTTPRVWLSAEVAGGANTAISLDSTGVVAVASAVTAAAIANETTAPGAAVGFSSPTTKAGGLSPANVPAGSAFALWVRRTATNSAALASDGVTIRCEGDTA